MPTPTYDLISSTTLASASGSVGFFSIPTTWQDLVIVINGGVTARTGQYLIFNGDSSNYTWVRATGTGSAAQSSTGSDAQISEVIENNSLASLILINIMDYKATNKHKTCLIRSNHAPLNGTEMRALRWANTAAISSITINAVGTTWLSGTSFALYGIAG